MTWFLKVASSSIGKKQAMAVTGLGLCGFLLAHLAGNCLLYVGEEAFNGYARTLESMPLLIPAEIALLALFVVHIGMALRVTIENRKARPIRYSVSATKGARTLASSTMWLTGLLTLIFVVLHLIHFKFIDHAAHGGLYRLVVERFQSLPYVVWYVVAVCALGLHVGHGLGSAVRTLGFQHPRYSPCVEWCSRAFGVLVAVGFAALPIWVYVTKASS